MLTTYNNHSYDINDVCLKPSAGYLFVVWKPRFQSLPEGLVFHNLCFIQTLPINIMKAERTKVIPKCVVLRIESVSDIWWKLRLSNSPSLEPFNFSSTVAWV